MKYTPKSEAKQHDNGPSCTVFEYTNDGEIGGAVGVINGRYPDQDYVLNTNSKEMFYVISGDGKLGTKSKVVALHPGDMAIMPSDEAYYLEGDNLQIFLANTPPFDPTQHKAVK